MASYYTKVTDKGLAKIANAQLTQGALTITQMAVGDGGGSSYMPTGVETVLKRELWRGTVSSMKVDATNPNWVVIEGVVPAGIGGFDVREIGLIDVDGDLIAIGNYPATYKPQLSDGATLDLVIRTVIEVSAPSVVTLAVDPLAVSASVEYVDNNLTQLDERVTGQLVEKAKSEMFPSFNVIDLEGMSVGHIVLIKSNVKIGNIILA